MYMQNINVYIYIYIYTYTHIYIYVYIHIYVHLVGMCCMSTCCASDRSVLYTNIVITIVSIILLLSVVLSLVLLLVLSLLSLVLVVVVVVVVVVVETIEVGRESAWEIYSQSSREWCFLICPRFSCFCLRFQTTMHHPQKGGQKKGGPAI